MAEPTCSMCGDTGHVHLVSFNCGGSPREGPPMPCVRCAMRLPDHMVKPEPEKYNQRTIRMALQLRGDDG